MSEAQGVKAVLIGHLGMPQGMVEAVRHITGIEEDALTPISNRGMSPEALAAEIQGIIGDDPAILFTDLQSGSCGFAALRLARSMPNVVVISAVNLPMLVDFAMHRTLTIQELVQRLLQKGRTSITVTPVQAQDNEHRAASG
jgi:mannose PTS system EIIA component